MAVSDITLDNPVTVLTPPELNLIKDEVITEVSRVPDNTTSIVKPLTIEEGLLKLVTPNQISDVYIRKTGYYIIPANNKFYYFNIGTINTTNANLFRFAQGKMPPLLREGFIVIDKITYFVTKEDILRGVIRPCRRVNLKKTKITYEDLENGNAYITPKPPPIAKPAKVEPDIERELGLSLKDGGIKETTPSTEGERVSDIDFSTGTGGVAGDKNKPGFSQTFKVDELKVADLVMQEQNEALRRASFEEEGSSWEDWEVENSV